VFSGPAVETHNLTKRFPLASGWPQLFKRVGSSDLLQGTLAVDCVSLTVAQGELFGLLGPNGAGKTTLVKMLCTLILPTSGSARVLGVDIDDTRRLRHLIGLASGDERSFYWRLTGRQNLEFFAALYDLPEAEARQRIETLLAQVELLDAADRPFRVYSSGMRQRLAIARALLHRPRVLFLDEPTRSLDPVASRQLQDFIRRDLVDRQGMTVFLTTHRLDEAQRLCDRIAIMHRGQVRVCDTIKALGVGEWYRLEVTGLDAQALVKLSQQLPGICLSTSENGAHQIELSVQDRGIGLPQVINAVAQTGGRVRQVERREVTLEQIFARHIGKASVNQRVTE